MKSDDDMKHVRRESGFSVLDAIQRGSLFRSRGRAAMKRSIGDAMGQTT